jgi:hypothetical protein
MVFIVRALEFAVSKPDSSDDAVEMEMPWSLSL